MDKAGKKSYNRPRYDAVKCGTYDHGEGEGYICYNADTKTLRAFKTDQKMNVESGFASYSSSDSNFNDEVDISTLNIKPILCRGVKENEYVNIMANAKSFLKVELKSAVYSRGKLSIWVKITYRIYEKISEDDWIGLYYAGKFLKPF